MAVALVSTGVQFPDSTIQTTAASSGGMTLISTVACNTGTTDIVVSGIASYKSIIIVTSNVVISGSQRVSVGLSVDNGSTYGSQENWTSIGGAVNGFIQFFSTNAGTSKPYTSMYPGSATALDYTTSSGAVNALRLRAGGGLTFSSGTILIYGIN